MYICECLNITSCFLYSIQSLQDIYVHGPTYWTYSHWHQLKEHIFTTNTAAQTFFLMKEEETHYSQQWRKDRAFKTLAFHRKLYLSSETLIGMGNQCRAFPTLVHLLPCAGRWVEMESWCWMSDFPQLAHPVKDEQHQLLLLYKTEGWRGGCLSLCV